MMLVRSAAALAASTLVLSLGAPLEAQQRFRLSGGAGFATLQNPNVDLGRTAVVGGALGIRFNDNLSVEGGFSFIGSDREYDLLGVPIDETQGGIPAFRYETNLYHLDGSFLYHIGRRQPFHPYVIAGGGLERRDEKRTDITFTFGENNVVIDRTEEVVLDTSDYEPTAHVGGGFDLYFLYNVAARVEFRLWLPPDIDRRTRMFFFGATYFF